MPQLQDLLRLNHLPWQDCADNRAHFFGMREGERLIAAGGLEAAAETALLRSIVVHQQFRRQGLGRKITQFLLDQARQMGLAEIYLLTESAEAYFDTVGFTLVTRDQVPESIRKTRQFATLCPDDASCMRLKF